MPRIRIRTQRGISLKKKKAVPSFCLPVAHVSDTSQQYARDTNPTHHPRHYRHPVRSLPNMRQATARDTTPTLRTNNTL